MLTTKQKEKIIKDFQIHKKDSGSPEVQIALLTKEITLLSQHLKKHRKDVHSRRGLLGMISKRYRLLNYLKKENPKKHSRLIKKLKI